MSLEVFVAPELERALNPDRWWQALERNAPRALVPVANAMRATAPKGKSGKLSRGFSVIAKRVSQGLIQGIEADIVTKVPYGHLVERGHKNVPRGPQRKGLKLSRQRRKELKVALESRRAGATGFTPGVFFGQRTLEARREQVLSLLGRLVMQELGR